MSYQTRLTTAEFFIFKLWSKRWRFLASCLLVCLFVAVGLLISGIALNVDSEARRFYFLYLVPAGCLGTLIWYGLQILIEDRTRDDRLVQYVLGSGGFWILSEAVELGYAWSEVKVFSLFRTILIARPHHGAIALSIPLRLGDGLTLSSVRQWFKKSESRSLPPKTSYPSFEKWVQQIEAENPSVYHIEELRPEYLGRFMFPNYFRTKTFIVLGVFGALLGWETARILCGLERSSLLAGLLLGSVLAVGCLCGFRASIKKRFRSIEQRIYFTPSNLMIREERNTVCLNLNDIQLVAEVDGHLLLDVGGPRPLVLAITTMPDASKILIKSWFANAH